MSHAHLEYCYVIFKVSTSNSSYSPRMKNTSNFNTFYARHSIHVLSTYLDNYYVCMKEVPTWVNQCLTFKLPEQFCDLLSKYCMSIVQMTVPDTAEKSWDGNVKLNRNSSACVSIKPPSSSWSGSWNVKLAALSPNPPASILLMVIWRFFSWQWQKLVVFSN